MIFSKSHSGGFQGLGENGELLNGYRVSFWDGEKVLEIGSGDGCTILWKYLMPLNCILTRVKMVSCVL